ncbi:hypothetical protein OpiT1DRAFT_03588 [Opitutaceae bacterium TAV1]|nr:hypothetical protein OpiT1DRAFT_03588 [Opitutaceae bacterium TAV1]
MNTEKHIIHCRARVLLAVASLLVAGGALPAADYYLQRNQTQGWHWHAVNAGTGWFPKPAGHAPLAEIDPAGIYHTNGFQARTREVNGAGETDLFEGATLVIDGGASGGAGAAAGSLAIKAAGSATAKVNHLVSASGTFVAGTGSRPQNFHIVTFEQSGATTFAATSPGRGYNLTVEKLTGAGTITFAEQEISDKSTAFNLAIQDASAYTGTIEFSGGVLSFESNLDAPGATLALKAGSTVDLNGKTLTLSALTVGDATKEPGTYAAADLQGHGVTLSGAGSIIVGASTP